MSHMLLLTCLLLAWGMCLGARCNTSTQYEFDGRCCDLCPPGQFVKEECTKVKSTVCIPCEANTFSDKPNDWLSCTKCSTCDPGLVLDGCSATRDTRCSCPQDSVCVTEDCSQCRRKITCGKGEQLKGTGANVQCEPCPNDTYSNREGGNCTKFSKCHHGFVVIFPGNKTHDTICRILPKSEEPTPRGPVEGDKQLTQVILAICLLMCVLSSVVVVVSVSLWMAKYRKQKRLTGTRNSFSGCPTTPTEETQSFQLSSEEKGDVSVLEIDLKTITSCGLPLYTQTWIE